MRTLLLLLAFIPSISFANTLVIGDSISLGWTAQLTDSSIGHTGSSCQLQPFVITSDTRNNEGSAHIVACIDFWMGKCQSCTYVAFNAGVWDVVAPSCNTGMPATIEEYVSNISKIAGRIRYFGYTPIFITTTPVPMNTSCSDGADPATVVQYNIAAKSLMNLLGVQVIDLYTYMLQYQATDGDPNDVHWNTTGYSLMANYIESQLPNPH